MEEGKFLGGPKISAAPVQTAGGVGADGKLVHELVEAQALLNPARLAVLFKNQALTYARLVNLASCLASQLVERGVGPEKIVTVAMPLSVELIVAILAVLKSGAAFNPVDPSWPDARLNLLVKEAGPRCIITTSTLQKRFDSSRVELLLADSEQQASTPLSFSTDRNHVLPESLAYVLFTSGSTGKPKAVGVEHRNIRNYVYSILATLAPPPQSVFALLTSVVADLGYTSLFASLCSGGALHLVPTENVVSPESLARCFEHARPDYIKITPSYIAALLSSDRAIDLLPQRCLILGGEPLRWPLIDRLRELSPELRIMNHYGPTETAVGVLVHSINYRDRMGASSVPLGKPLANTQVHILGENMQPVQAGAMGEIYIGGLSVSRGYLGRADLTAARFVPDPNSSTPGQRLYRTGDVALKLENDGIEFQSRIDDQVKIRGYRIELGEIESAILVNPSVQKAVVQAEGQSDDAVLTAYVELKKGESGNREVLRRWLAERLPDHMVPNRFVFVAEMRCLASGKIDRQQLKTQTQETADVDQPGARPFTVKPLEEQILRIWQKIIKTESIQPTENFFEVGGNSLRLIQLQSELNREFNRNIPVSVLFTHSTIRDQAAYLINGHTKATNDGEKIAELRRAALASVRPRHMTDKGGL